MLFWKIIGKFMAMENFSIIIMPVIATGVIKYFWNTGDNILAWLDVILIIFLLLLTLQLYEENLKNDERFFWNLERNIIIFKTVIQRVFVRKLWGIYCFIAHLQIMFVFSYYCVTFFSKKCDARFLLWELP